MSAPNSDETPRSETVAHPGVAPVEYPGPFLDQGGTLHVGATTGGAVPFVDLSDLPDSARQRITREWRPEARPRISRSRGF